jgi:hypothetical protein
MGATTFQIGDVSYGALSNSAGRKAMSIKVAAPQQRVLKFHPPGTDGNLIILDGRTGIKITFRARYVGTRTDILADWEADRNSWINTVFDVVDDAGTTHERCILESAEMVGEGVRGTAASDTGFFDVIGVVSSEA